MPEPICCGMEMTRTPTGIYECDYRSHHPCYAAPELVELLSAAYTAGLTGEPLADFLARHELHTRLTEDGHVDTWSKPDPSA